MSINMLISIMLSSPVPNIDSLPKWRNLCKEALLLSHSLKFAGSVPLWRWQKSSTVSKKGRERCKQWWNQHGTLWSI